MTENPSAETYAVGWALFHARCLVDTDDRDLIDTQWAIPATRKFWLEQAQIALDAAALHRLEVGNARASQTGSEA